MRFKVILALVNDDYQDEVIEAAKKAGATGVTILNARGEGVHDQKSFLGLNMESQKDMLLFLVEDFNSDQIMDAIYEAGKFGEHGNGIAFPGPLTAPSVWRARSPFWKKRPKNIIYKAGLESVV